MAVALVVVPLRAEDVGTKALLERALAAESASLEVLFDHHRLEEDLLSPDVDRLAVFLSVDGERLAQIEQIQLLVDASRHNPEFGGPRSGRPLTVPLFVQRVGAGSHTLRLDLRLKGGRGLLSESVRVEKAGRARFVEFRLDDGRNPRLSVRQW